MHLSIVSHDICDYWKAADRLKYSSTFWGISLKWLLVAWQPMCEITSSCPARWAAIRHLFQFQQRGVWPSCWLDVEDYVCCSQGNTFVIDLVNRMFNLRWDEHVQQCNASTLFTTSLSSISMVSFVISALVEQSSKDPSRPFTGFSSWPSPSSLCILSTCCWRRPMKEVSLSGSHQIQTSWRLWEGFWIAKSLCIVSSQVHWCMSSWVTKPLGCQGNSPLPAPSPCRTLAVRDFLFSTAQKNSKSV